MCTLLKRYYRAALSSSAQSESEEEEEEEEEEDEELENPLNFSLGFLNFFTFTFSGPTSAFTYSMDIKRSTVHSLEILYLSLEP